MTEQRLDSFRGRAKGEMDGRTAVPQVVEAHAQKAELGETLLQALGDAS